MQFLFAEVNSREIASDTLLFGIKLSSGEFFLSKFVYLVTFQCLVIGNILDDVLRVYKREHREQLPQEVIIYRAGTSEGAFGTVSQAVNSLSLSLLID